MRNITLLFTMFLFLSSSVLFAQNKKITGTVTSADDGSTIPGVSVVAKGFAGVGTITDFNGKYSLDVPANATVLVFSFVGMKSQEVVIAGATVDAVLKSEDVGLEEVVVVGYGVQTKRELTGAIATVKGDAIKSIPVQSFDQALQGKATGVNITLPNGVLGNPPVIRVRGVNSISASSSPLVVVDGVPVFTGDLSRTSASLNVLGDINPSDIASIEILKDAAATAIYGSRAANGVIIITTKKGAEGNVKVTYDGSFGYTQPYRIYDVMNAEQYVHLKNTAWQNANPTSAIKEIYFLNKDAEGNTIDTDWADYIYRTGFQHNQALSISGGTKSTSYFLSLGFSENEGMVITNSLDRKSIRLNLEHKLNKIITIGANATFSNTFTNAPNTGSLYGSNFSTAGAGRLAFVTSPVVPAKLADGTYNVDWAGNRIGLLNNLQAVGFFNPAFVFDNNYNNAQSDRLLATVFLNAEIIKGLFFRTVYGLDNSAIESKTFWDPRHGDGRTNGGEAYNYFDRRNRWNWTNTLNYSLTLSKLNVGLLIGNEQQYSDFQGWSGRRTGLADSFFTDYQGTFTTPQAPPAALLTENYFISNFGRFTVNFDKRYFIELSGRRDGFSGLATGKKYGNFGGASFMWSISNEEFIKNSDLGNIVSDLRLKTSYGKVGNISGVGNYASLSLYSAGVYNSNPTLAFSQAGNPDLGWEASTKFDVGLAFGILNDKLQFELGYYNNTVDGLILDVPQSPSKGIPGNTLPMNVGSMNNTGYEFTLTSNNIRSESFNWTTTLNFSYLKNEVTSLAAGVPYLSGVTQLETTNRTIVGSPIGLIWGVETDGVDPQTGRRVFIRRDTDANGKVTTAKVLYDHSAVPANRWTNMDGTVSRAINVTQDGTSLGSTLPKYFGGLDNNLSFKGFDFNLGLTYALDFVVYNGSKAGLRDQRNWNNAAEVHDTYWKNPGDITNIPRPVWGDNVSNGSSMVISENVESGNFVKIRNISLGYTLRNNSLLEKAGIQSVRVYSQVFNAYVFTNYTGADPEISSNGDYNLALGVDRNTVPQARTFSFGLNLTF